MIETSDKSESSTPWGKRTPGSALQEEAAFLFHRTNFRIREGIGEKSFANPHTTGFGVWGRREQGKSMLRGKEKPGDIYRRKKRGDARRRTGAFKGEDAVRLFGKCFD